MFNEIITSIFGSILTLRTAKSLRNAAKWKLFQEEIGILKTKFLPIRRKIERKLRVSIVEVEAARRQNYESLEKAVAQVMPYVSEISKRARLERCLSDYQKAPEIRDSGYLPADLAGEFKNRPADMFSDPEKYIYFLINILESMERIESGNFFGKILGLV